MLFELVADIAKLSLIVAGLYCALQAYVRRLQPMWSGPLARRQLAILLLLVLAVLAIKVSEDVLGGESGPVDTAILLFIRHHVPTTMIGFFAAVTVTGSSTVVFALTVVAVIALLWAKHRYEALLLAASVTSALNCAESATTKNPHTSASGTSTAIGPPNANPIRTQHTPLTTSHPHGR